MIRTATEADAPLVQELWHAFNEEVPDAPWREGDTDDFKPDVALLAGADGVAALTRLGPRRWFLDVVFVRPAARGKGLGTELVRAAAEHVRAQGSDMLELEVLETNAGARRLYDRLGFTTVERTLAAPVERLLGTGDGATYGTVHVQTDDVDTVRRNVEKYLPRVARGATADVAEDSDSWVRIRSDATDADPTKLKALAKELSYTSGGVTLSLGVESGAVVRYTLFDRGSMVDEYASVPEFAGPLPPGDVIALGANPTVVARLTGADPKRVREIARTAASPADLPPAEDLYRAIAELLGVEVG